MKEKRERARKAGRDMRPCHWSEILSERKREGREVSWKFVKLLCKLRKVQKDHWGVLKTKVLRKFFHLPEIFLLYYFLPCSVTDWE